MYVYQCRAYADIGGAYPLVMTRYTLLRHVLDDIDTAAGAPEP